MKIVGIDVYSYVAGYARGTCIVGKSVNRSISAQIGGVINERFPIDEAVHLGAPESMADAIRRRPEACINQF